MRQRRSALVLALSTVLCAGTAAAVSPAAFAAPVAPAAASGADDGLYGKADPKYDGVWRQSVALLAQDTIAVTPSAKALTWLADQQCADGSFAAYRPDPGAKCGKKTVADVNATAAAVQALAALGGHGKAVEKSVDWLKSVQNPDGGWGYNPGAPSDTNSVSVVIGALAAVGQDPAKTLSEKDKSPFDSLIGFQVGCDAKAAERGAFAYQPDKKGTLVPNDDATAAAALAGLDEGFAAEPLEEDDKDSPKALACGKDADQNGEAGDDPEDAAEAAAEAGAAYLAGVLEKNGQHLLAVTPGAEDQPDYGNTADAVIALAAGGHGDEARAALGWLEKNLADWDKATSDPAALGSLVLASHTAGEDPRDFGGTDLVERLNATGPKPAEIATPEETAAAAKDGDDDAGDDDGDSSTVLTVSLIGAGLAAGAGIGFLLSGRRKRQGL